MSSSAQAQRIVEQLRFAVSSGALPVAASESGARLLARLSAPVRLALLGPRGAGKARVRDILAGRAVLPRQAHTASVELVFGSRERGRLVYSDGSAERFDGAPPDSTDWSSVALVRLQAPLPVLERISLLEVVADDPQDDLIAAAAWAVRRSDMLLWCTSDFGPAERAAWDVVPDRLKDHTYLVPRLPRGALFPTTIRDDVVGLLPLHMDPGPEDGAAALRSAVLAHVDRGRREDFDGALMFLERFKTVLPAIAKAAPVKTAAVPAEAPPSAADPALDPDTLAAPVRTRSVDDGFAAPQGGQADGLPEEDAAQGATAAPGDCLSPAFAMIRDAARSIDASIEGARPEWPSAVLAQCVETIEGLPSTSAVADPELSDLVAEAWDLMMLLQLEADASAAADAVALLLQVRRAVERRMAVA